MAVFLNDSILSNRVPFEDIKEKILSYGDWMISKKETHWKLYAPTQGDSKIYNIYHVGFSSDPASFFCQSTNFGKYRKLTLSSSDSEKLELIKTHLEALCKKPETSFKFAENNCPHVAQAHSSSHNLKFCTIL